MSTSTTSLIVRCFNEEAHLGRLLRGVAQQSLRPDEIIIVDSGSTDGTLDVARQFDVRIVSIEPEAFSFGRALNVGIAASTGQLAIFASAHVYPIYNTWLVALTAPFADDLVALAYGRQQTPPGGRFSEERLLSQWFPASSTLRQKHPFCNNANAAIRRSLWEQHPYDEQLTGLEDLAWARYAMENGLAIAYVAEAPVVHVHEESFAQVLNRYQREAIAHKDIYSDQRMSSLTAARLAMVNIAGDYRAAMSFGRLRQNFVDIPRFRAAQFLGTYRGFAQSGPVTDALRRRFYYPSRPTEHPAPVAAPLGERIDYGEVPEGR